MSDLRTTETLRGILFDAIADIKAGKMTVEAAKSIALLADKVIGSARLELDYAMTLSHLSTSEQGVTTGPVVLTNESHQQITAPQAAE